MASRHRRSSSAAAHAQDNYSGREEYAAQQLATSWLALYLGRHTTVTIDAETYDEPIVTEPRPGKFRGSSSPLTPSLSP